MCYQPKEICIFSKGLLKERHSGQLDEVWGLGEHSGYSTIIDSSFTHSRNKHSLSVGHGPGTVLCTGCGVESPTLSFNGLKVKWGNRQVNEYIESITLRKTCKIGMEG